MRAARSEWQERAASRLAKAELIDKFKVQYAHRLSRKGRLLVND